VPLFKKRDPDRPKPAVLICCPEALMVRLIQVNLERQGYPITVISSGAGVVELVRSEQIKVLVLDEDLVDPTVKEITEEGRALPDGTCVNIIVQRKRPSDPSDDSFGDGSPPVYITKGFDPRSWAGILARMSR
jgi:DNA-binding response OmpR family regulator